MSNSTILGIQLTHNLGFPAKILSHGRRNPKILADFYIHKNYNSPRISQFYAHKLHKTRVFGPRSTEIPSISAELQKILEFTILGIQLSQRCRNAQFYMHNLHNTIECSTKSTEIRHSCNSRYTNVTGNLHDFPQFYMHKLHNRDESCQHHASTQPNSATN